METDERVYQRWLDGDEDALRILLERFRESLTCFIMGYVHSMDDAEELMLDTFVPGTKISCRDWSAGGSFDATVMEVSEYPTSGDSFFYTGNPNTSFYSFTASIDEGSNLEITDGDWIQITVAQEKSTSDAIVIDRAFVRSENGSHYVYKDDNGILKKHYIKVGSFISGGYYAKIDAGLKRSDKIAFPYGTGVEDGAATVTVDGSELYGSDYDYE